MSGITLKDKIEHINKDTENDFEALNYVSRIYWDFLQTKDEFCQITLNRSQAKKLVEDVDSIVYMKQALIELEKIKKANTSEALEKLEECANGMKDLPKSNWIDLAEDEAELDLKIMDWIETIQFELFKGKQALLKTQELEKENKSLRDCIRDQQKDYDLLEYHSNENGERLRIIFEKRVDVFRLKVLDFNTFNQLQRSCRLPELTQEEFDTLKGYCK